MPIAPSSWTSPPQHRYKQVSTITGHTFRSQISIRRGAWSLSKPPARHQWVPTPQPNVGTTPQPNVGTTPQPSVVHIPDANLRTVVQQRIGNQITTNTLLNLTHLYAPDRGITSLTGLEHARNLRELNIWRNSISDVSPLTGLTSLTRLDIQNNSLSDISTLAGVTQLTYLDLRGNPLNAAAINTHIPAIQANGTQVYFDNRAPTTPQPNVGTTPQPQVINTPQPNVASTPEPTQRGAGLAFRFEIVGAAERSGATVNEALDSPLLVRVLDLYDNGVPNVRVSFKVPTGKGRVTSRGNGSVLRVQTDSDGYARTDFTPTVEGTVTVEVSVRGFDETAEFTIRTGTTPAVGVKNPQVDTRTPTVPIDPSQPAIYWTTWSDEIRRANLDRFKPQNPCGGSELIGSYLGCRRWEDVLDRLGRV